MYIVQLRGHNYTFAKLFLSLITFPSLFYSYWVKVISKKNHVIIHDKLILFK